MERAFTKTLLVNGVRRDMPVHAEDCYNNVTSISREAGCSGDNGELRLTTVGPHVRSCDVKYMVRRNPGRPMSALSEAAL